MIAHLRLSCNEYNSLAASAFADEIIVGAERLSMVVVEGRGHQCVAPRSLPLVVCWLGDEFGGEGPDEVDLVVGEADLDDAIAAVEAAPLAAVTLALLLRAGAGVEVEAGLVLESMAYSVLQSGPEFAAWRASEAAEPQDDGSDIVAVERDGPRLVVTLDRPARHNAINARLRDQLAAALTIAVADDTVSSVELAGRGPSFCSGGDLDEFGTRADPATAHVTRLARSPARILDRLADITTARVHGHTLGGGLEMAAFAGRVTAHPDTVFGLPEVAIGLIPGAGGTVSIPRRIGRHRTAALALTGRRIDAATALEWGLVDDVVA